MFKLRDFLISAVGRQKADIPFEGIYCAEANLRQTLLVNNMHETYAGYSYTLVRRGELRFMYNDTEVTLHPGDLFIYSPGAPSVIIGGSDDYAGISLICDESVTLETSVVRNLIRTAFYPMTGLQQPTLHLTEQQAEHFSRVMKALIRNQNNPTRYMKERMHLLYSLFMLDLLDVIEYTMGKVTVSEHSAELFIAFMQLLPNHFVEHHDIGFYASELCITKTHLSRVVRQVTGHTVIDYINQLLMMEAQWLLRQSDASITEIAERLHFSSQSSFTKFFIRMKGMSPRDYRSPSRVKGASGPRPQ